MRVVMTLCKLSGKASFSRSAACAVSRQWPRGSRYSRCRAGHRRAPRRKMDVHRLWRRYEGGDRLGDAEHASADRPGARLSAAHGGWSGGAGSRGSASSCSNSRGGDVPSGRVANTNSSAGSLCVARSSVVPSGVQPVRVLDQRSSGRCWLSSRGRVIRSSRVCCARAGPARVRGSGAVSSELGQKNRI